MSDHAPAIALHPIGHIESAHASAGTAPPQALHQPDATGRVIVRPELAPGLLGLDAYPYLWLITLLDRQPPGAAPLTLVPRATEHLGLVQGVFASRAPRRPCPIGLSLVRQIGIADNVVTFGGVDLFHGTPVLDIKPWFADCDLPAGAPGLSGGGGPEAR